MYGNNRWLQEKPVDEIKKLRNNLRRRPMDLQVKRFSDIDLNDSFFDSLRAMSLMNGIIRRLQQGPQLIAIM